MSKTVVVIGATGTQGGSVVDALLADKSFAVRAVTRDPTSAKAQALASKGAEVVAGDLDSADSLTAAFRGAYAVFGVTDPWGNTGGKEAEVRQGKNIGDASKAAGVQHLVFSTLDNVTKVTNGRITGVEHFDAKAEAFEYIQTLGVATTAFMPGFFMSNFPGQVRPGQTGALTYATILPPSTEVPVFDAAADTGKYVKAILLDPQQYIGKAVRAATKYVSLQGIMDEFAAALPKFKGAQAIQLPRPVLEGGMAQAGMPAAAIADLLDMFEYFGDSGYFAGAALDTSILAGGDKAATLGEFAQRQEAWKE